MQDAFAYCAELVRGSDRDRFLATLFAPADRRDALHALYAFNIQVARVPDAARQPLAAEIRLQWWREVLEGQRSEEARANPVALALLQTIERHSLAVARLGDLVETRRLDLYDEPIATVADLENYARRTSSTIFALAAQVLSGTDASAVTDPAGIAYAIAGLLRAVPRHAARRQLYIPADLIRDRQLNPEDIFAARSSDRLTAALADLREVARRHLDTARENMSSLPPDAVPALLPLALVRPLLDRPVRSDPFKPAEISPRRKQWLIWRAARNPSRIAA